MSVQENSSHPAGRRAKQIAHRLRSEILTGRMSAGERLTEAELAERFQVGRSLAREAVQQLSLQGLLVSRPNCGAAVAPEAPREIRQLIVPIRRTIEAYALQLVFDELSEDDFRHWELILDRMRLACEQRDFPAIAEADLDFHRYLLERANQPDLLLIWDTLVGRIRFHFQRTQRRYQELLDIVAEHSLLLDGYRRGDLTTATKLLTANIE